MRTITNISTNPLAALYAFASKERDTETGLSYFGARYYSSELSIWLSVDPMSGNYPSTSPYAYCRNNPIILYDPNGMFDDWVEDKNGHVYWNENATSQETTNEGETYLGKEGQRNYGSIVVNYNSDATKIEQETAFIYGSSTDNTQDISPPSAVLNDHCGKVIDKFDKIISETVTISEIPLGAIEKIALKANIYSNVASLAPDIVRYVSNPTKENACKLSFSVIGSALSFVPYAGPVLSVVWNSIDMGGGFDKLYNRCR